MTSQRVGKYHENTKFPSIFTFNLECKIKLGKNLKKDSLIELPYMLEETDKRRCWRTLISEDAEGTLINEDAGGH